MHPMRSAGDAPGQARATEAGVLAPGRLADIAVLDRDPFAVDPRELHGIRCVRTYVGGVLVHAADPGPL